MDVKDKIVELHKVKLGRKTISKKLGEKVVESFGLELYARSCVNHLKAVGKTATKITIEAP